MKQTIQPMLVFLVILSLSACGTNVNTNFEPTDVIRVSVGTPEMFEPPAGVRFDSFSCKSPLQDPRDGTQIIMVRSNGSMGDYAVPQGKYGIAGNELLRINCSTGEIIGVVRR